MARANGARGAVWTLVVGSLWLAASPVRAIEFWDERVQIHGFYETRMSFGWEDFDASNEIDMYGWLHVLNVETEVEIAPDGWGPFDMVAAFARVEVKYDCVWNHACGLLPSVDAFGNHPNNLPHRAQTGRRTGLAGSQIIGDRRPYWFAKREYLAAGEFFDVKAGQRDANSFVYGSTNVGLFGASAGPDGQLGDFDDIRHERGSPNAFLYDGNWTDPTTMLPGDDDAGLYMFNRTSKCKVGNWTQKASNQAGFSNRELIWAIDDCEIEPIGFTRFVANPFRDEAFGTDPVFGGDRNPVLLAINLDPSSAGFGAPLDPNANGIPDATQLPLRPGSERNINDKAKKWESQGLFAPNIRTRRLIRSDSFDDTDQNAFSLNDLQWNRGASQQEWKELRELYLEFEAFESQLWVRAGKQTIVWGKTELFRNQDQWNPVDIAIGPLASLEESRIALWAVRGIWSFYEVGPLEDVRLELVTLYDEFEPTDIGRCGEPFVPRTACNKSYGLWVHGENGTGVAGENRPPDPWNDAEGIEVGARIEFRYDRFSFALTDYYGFNDLPYVSVLFNYDRNVDPLTGRPRHSDARGECDDDDIDDPSSDCLLPDHDPLRPGESGDVIELHSINQSLFAWICAGTVGVAPAVDASACAFTLFNSPQDPGLGVGFAQAISSIMAGSAPSGQTRYVGLIGDVGATNPVTGPGGALDLALGVTTPLVGLVNNAAPGNEDPDPAGPQNVPAGLDRVLTTEQEALLGCGDFYFTDCDGAVHEGPDGILGTDDDTLVGGIDLANTDASVLLQAFPWFEGTKFNPYWDTTDPTLPQPGTVAAAFNDGASDPTDPNGADAPDSRPGEVETGPAGSRYEDGQSFILPGAHYDPAAFAAAGVLVNAMANGIEVDPWVLANLAGYDPTVDGSVCTPAGVCRAHPFTNQIWSNEMAILSWNLLMATVALGATDDETSLSVLDRNNPLALGRCSFRQPQFCSFVSGLAAQARNTTSKIRAGGNRRFGRRNFVWASVGDVALRYEKRNILGFSMDFAEDTTKSSWGVEFTYIDDTLTADNDSITGLREVDEYNLTLSVDRPTFINFLNANRTFFINSQLFMGYVQGYGDDMLRDGPFTALLLLTANTGYFQDRFLVSAAGVYDFTSQSMAFLPSVQYRFTENFSITIGAAVLAGKWKGGRDQGINNFSATSDTSLNDTIYVENGISPARDLDNFFLRLRYTF